MLNVGTFGQTPPPQKVPGEIQHIQHIQHFKVFGASRALKFNMLRGLEQLMPPSPLKCWIWGHPDPLKCWSFSFRGGGVGLKVPGEIQHMQHIQYFLGVSWKTLALQQLWWDFFMDNVNNKAGDFFEIFDQNCPPVEVSPTYIYIYIYGFSQVLGPQFTQKSHF